MKKFIIYHNPKCSKSRKALEILQDHNINLLIIEYLKTPLNLEQLTELRTHFALRDFIRTEESLFKELKLSLEDESNVLQAVLKNPILMQRPIVIVNGKAMIARPPERVLELIHGHENQ